MSRPLAAEKLNPLSDTLYWHVCSSPGCVTVKTWPSTVTMPVRGEAVGLGATARETVPFPEPLPPVTVIQLSDRVAVHAHPGSAVTLKFGVPPAAGSTVTDEGDRP